MIGRKSGYDATTGICWNFGNPGESHLHRDCQCPAHRASPENWELAYFGRGRSGARWFYAALILPRSGEILSETGYAETEEAATELAMAALCRLKTLPLMHAVMSQQMARDEFKRQNAARRAARPPSKARGAKTIEYLYGHRFRYQITKKTKARIYFCLWPVYADDRTVDLSGEDIGFVDRAALERGESVWYRRRWDSLSLTPPQPDQPQPLPDLSQLKAEMAEAHPDRGGSNQAFIAARARYVEARRSMARRRRAAAE